MSLLSVPGRELANGVPAPGTHWSLNGMIPRKRTRTGPLASSLNEEIGQKVFIAKPLFLLLSCFAT